MSRKTLREIPYESFYDDMVEAIPTTLIPDGPNQGQAPLATAQLDRRDDNLLLATLSAWAEVTTLLSFYNARISEQGYFATVSIPERLDAMARSVGVVPPPATAASAWLSFKVADPPGQHGPYTLPAGTAVQAVTPPPKGADGKKSAPAVFETLTDQTVYSEWSGITSAVSVPPVEALAVTDNTIALRVVSPATPLKKGDALLLTGSTTTAPDTVVLLLLTVTTAKADPSNKTTDVVATCRDATGKQNPVTEVHGPRVYSFAKPAALLGSTAAPWSKAKMNSRRGSVLLRGGIGVVVDAEGDDPVAGRANGGIPWPTVINDVVVTPTGTVLLATTGSGLLTSTLDQLKAAAASARDNHPPMGLEQPWDSPFYDALNAPADVVWTAPKTPPPGKSILSLQMSTSGAIYAGAPKGAIYRSTDDGNTWSPIQTGGVKVKGDSTAGWTTTQTSLPRSASVAGVAAAPTAAGKTSDLVVVSTSAGVYGAVTGDEQSGVAWSATNANTGLPVPHGMASVGLEQPAVLAVGTEQAAWLTVSATKSEDTSSSAATTTLASTDSPVEVVDHVTLEATSTYTGKHIAVAGEGPMMWWATTTGLSAFAVFGGSATEVWTRPWSTTLPQMTALVVAEWEPWAANAEGLARWGLFSGWTQAMRDGHYGTCTALARSGDTIVAIRPLDPAPFAFDDWPLAQVPIDQSQWSQAMGTVATTDSTAAWVALAKTTTAPDEGWCVLQQAAKGKSPGTLRGYRTTSVDKRSITAFGKTTVTTVVTLTDVAATEMGSMDVARTTALVDSQELQLRPLAPRPVDLYCGGELPLAADVPSLANEAVAYVSGKRMRANVAEDSTLWPCDARGHVDLSASPATTIPDPLFVVRFLPGAKPPKGSWLLIDSRGSYFVLLAARDALAMDWPSQADPMVSQSTAVAPPSKRQEQAADCPVTRALFLEPLDQWLYDQGITIDANVAFASHGRTVARSVLGSGNGSVPSQSFTLRTGPLTRAPSEGSDADATTLQIEVAGLAWAEVSTLATAGAADRVYVTGQDSKGNTTVTFGDGVHGARLPTGINNVVASYRAGSGSAGQVGPGTLTLLRKKPLFVKAVTNPESSRGARDRSTPSEVRQGASHELKTLHRVSSLTDYELVAGAMPGVAHATARRVGGGVALTLVSDAATAGSALARLSQTVQQSVEPLRAPVGAGAFLSVGRAVVVPFFVTATVRTGRTDARVRHDLQAALRDRWSRWGPPNKTVRRSDLISVIASVPGVRDVENVQARTYSPSKRRAQPPHRPPTSAAPLVDAGVDVTRASSQLDALIQEWSADATNAQTLAGPSFTPDTLFVFADPLTVDVEVVS